MNLLPLLASAALGAALVSCGPIPLVNNNFGGGSNYLAGIGVTSSIPVSVNPAEASSFWDGDTVAGAPSIRINRAEQKAYFYKNGELVGVAPISSGNAAHTTPAGSYVVTEKDDDHASSTYGSIVDIATGATINADADSRKDKPAAGQKFVGAPMPHFLRFNYGIGMHAGYLPGYAASHGCVRMPKSMAQKFFEHAEIGTPVIVK
ncbi:MAG: L,D-transpeptidase family protein [Roseibacillus sp.]|jgi:lipoprotein-anchoring transpeptidase ErfK/SrfK